MNFSNTNDHNAILTPSKSPYLNYVKYNECAYCKANGFVDFANHNNKNCARLARLNPCMFCGASGLENHTPM